MDLTFADAFRLLLELEGGFADDPVDKGGPTNHGVTQATWDSYTRRHELEPSPVELISTDQAREVYLELYWQEGLCDELPSPLNVVHFDALVNHGPAAAAPMMLAARFAPDQPAEREAYAYLALRYNLYQRIVAKDPSQGKFLKGWKARVDHVRRFIGL